MGKHKPGRERDILVKFVGYRPKEAIINARNNAGSNPLFHDVYVNEDLSRETSLLYYKARTLKKAEKLSSATTRDGRILVSRFKGDPLVVVNSEEELNEIASRGTFANTLSREAPTEPINDRLMREAGMPPARERKHAPPAPQTTQTPTTSGFQRRPASAGPKHSGRRSSSVGTPRARVQRNTGSGNQPAASASTPATQTGSASGGGGIPAPQSHSTPDTGQPAGDPGGAASSDPNAPEWSFETY